MINGNGFYSEIAIEIIRLLNQNNEMSWKKNWETNILYLGQQKKFIET